MPKNHPMLAPEEARALWREARRRLALVDLDPPVTRDRIDRLLAALPPRQPGEDLGGWLRRAGGAEQRPSAEILTFPGAGRVRFTPLTEIVRLAADSAGVSGEVPLPDPGRAIESADGRFRLTIAAEAGGIRVGVQALGLAGDLFANRRIGLAGAGGASPLAAIALDGDGDGECRLDDRPDVRRALLRPVIGLIDDEDA
jgi:hypothetical protein